MPYIGEIAALATALCWSIAVVFFRQLGGVFSPLSLNLWKGIISIAGLTLSLFFISAELPSTRHLLWLLLSGIIGIGIGDTTFFAALNRLGERSTQLVAETLAPIFTALLAIVWISERLNAFQWSAIAIILFGVDMVLRSRKQKMPDAKIQTTQGRLPGPGFSGATLSGTTLSGLGFAAIAALCQAVGAVIGRDILTSSQVDVVSASLIRLLGGLIFIIPMLMFSRQRWFPKQQAGGKVWKLVFVATFLGTFIAMNLQMFSFAHAEAAIVQSLFASCIIFSLIIARFQGQKISRSAFFGSLTATAGVALIFLI